MSALISSIIAFIVAGLAILGLVPHQQIQPVPQLPQQNIQQVTSISPDTNQPSLQVLDAQDYPQKITVAYRNMPHAARSLFLCVPSGACTEWGVDFAPQTPNGTFFMTYDVPGSTKHIGAGTFTVQAVDFSTGKVYAVSQPFTVTANNSSDVSVPGMSKYTDPDFGFSFWYPSGWTITNTTIKTSSDAEMWRAAREETDKIIKIVNSAKILNIQEIHSTGDAGIAWSAACHYCFEKIYFGTSTNSWMHDSFEQNGYTINKVDSSKLTMGGLHIIYTGQSAKYVIPLSASNFVILDLGLVENNTVVTGAEPLAKTIVATDPSVATPMSADEQIKTIQAEKDAYAGR